MNRIYRLVWNHTLQAFVVGSEFARGHGKRARTNDARRAPSPLLLVLATLGCSGSACATDARLAELLGVANQYLPTASTSVGASVTLPAAGQAGVAVSASVHPALPAPAAVQSLRSPALAASSSLAVAPAVRSTLDATADVAIGTPLQVVVDAGVTVPTGAVAQTARTVAPATTASVRQTVQPLQQPVRGSLAALAAGDAGAAAQGVAATLAAVPASVSASSQLAQAVAADAERLGLGGTRLLTGLVEATMPARENLLVPVEDVVGTASTLVEGGRDRLPASLGAVVIDTANGTGALLADAGTHLGGTLAAATGAAPLGTLVSGATGTVQDGLQTLAPTLVDGELAQVVDTSGLVVHELTGDALAQVEALLAGSTGGSLGLASLGDQLGGAVQGTTEQVATLLQGQSGSSNPVATVLAGAVGDTSTAVGDSVAQLLSTAPQQTVPVALDGVGTLVAHLGTGLAGTGAGTALAPLTDTLGSTLDTAGSGVGTTAAELAQGDVGGTVNALAGTVQGSVQTLLGGVTSTPGSGDALGDVLENVSAGVAQLGDGLQGVTSSVGETVGGLLAGLGGGTGSGNPLGDALTGTLGNVTGTVGTVVGGSVGGVVAGVTDAAAPVLDTVGETLGGTVGTLTGSQSLAGTTGALVDGVGSGLQTVGSQLQQGDVVGAVDSLGNTVGTVGSGLVTGVTGTVGGLTGSTSGTSGLGNLLGGTVGAIGDGLGGVVGSLTGATPAAVPSVPAQTGSPGLIIGTGGLTGSLGELVGPTTSSLFGGDGYVRNGDLAVSSANIQQGYANTSLLGIPLINATPVGTLLDGVGGAATGGNSHLTLIGGVTSDSYIYNINNGATGGLLGLLLPGEAPAWASECLNLLGVAATDCWAVNAAQDYQVLIGDGAYANGSKEVVIGTNARHELALQDADVAFPGAGRNDATDPTGVPTADYDARLGHSVVIGDDAFGSANGQTLIGAGATSNKANTVALGYLSNADRGGQDNYTAFGLSAAQTSIGEVAVGSDGRERQITHVAAGSAATDAVNVAQLQGALADIDVDGLFAVTYDSDASGNPDYTRVTLGGSGAASATVIGNLAAGQVSLGSREAVNGSQLYALGQGITGYLGGGAAINVGGSLSMPTYTINNLDIDLRASSATYHDVGSALDAISQSLANLEGVGGGGGVSDLYDDLAVHYDVDGSTGQVVNKVTLTGDFSGDPVGISNLADGAVALGSSDAVNGGQLYQTNTELATFMGGTTAYDSSTGTWTAPSFQIGGFNATGTVTTTSYGDVTSAFDAVDDSLRNLNNRIRNISVSGSPYVAVNSEAGPAEATGEDAVAVGPDAVASADNSVALGNGSVADRANTVSVGSAGNERQITNVADGSQATDAVNVRQLQASQVGTVRYDTTSTGAVDLTSVTLGSTSTGPTTVHNVAAGTADTDAVNLAQLNSGIADAKDWSKGYVDSRVNEIDNRASAGVASAMAMAGLPQPYEAGRSMAAVAASSFNGESSLAVGLSGITEGGRWIYKVSGSTNTRGDAGVSIGAGIQW